MRRQPDEVDDQKPNKRTKLSTTVWTCTSEHPPASLLYRGGTPEKWGYTYVHQHSTPADCGNDEVNIPVVWRLIELRYKKDVTGILPYTGNEYMYAKTTPELPFPLVIPAGTIFFPSKLIAGINFDRHKRKTGRYPYVPFSNPTFNNQLAWQAAYGVDGPEALSLAMRTSFSNQPTTAFGLGQGSAFSATPSVIPSMFNVPQPVPFPQTFGHPFGVPQAFTTGSAFTAAQAFAPMQAIGSTFGPSQAFGGSFWPAQSFSGTAGPAQTFANAFGPAQAFNNVFAQTQVNIPDEDVQMLTSAPADTIAAAPATTIAAEPDVVPMEVVWTNPKARCRSKITEYFQSASKKSGLKKDSSMKMSE